MRVTPRRMSALLLALLLAPSLASAQIEEPRIPLQTKMTELTRFRAQYADSYNKKNADAVVAMYADDAVIVTDMGAMISGAAGVRSFLGDASQFPHLVIESDDMQIYGNTAVDIGVVKMHPAGGGEMVSRYVVVLRRGMNEWKLVRASLTPVR